VHELSIALAVLDVAAEAAERHTTAGGGRVVAVHLKLGALSGVVKEALLGAYELAREGTPLAGAALVIEEVPVTARCPACGTSGPVVSPQCLCCAACGLPAAEVVAGRELQVVALEVES
jgi:hydrogenase nickel incorporation protein HypA/HybF